MRAKQKAEGSARFLRGLVFFSAFVSLGAALFLLGYILLKGIPHVKPGLFQWKYNSGNLSLLPSLINTLSITCLSLLFALPMGVGGAVYLVEYAKRGSKLVALVRLMSETLSGIPSIVYGLFGSFFFVSALGFGNSLLAGACTLSIMILPLLLRSTEEALLAVPDSYREGSFGLGAGKLRSIFQIVLPAAMPGILSGLILSVGRILGESAALLYTAGTVPELAKSLFDSARTLSVHMYVLSGEALYLEEAYATALVLLFLVIAINALSKLLGKKLSKGKTNG